MGEGTQKIHWTRAVIHRLADKIKQGTKFFVGHGTSNDHTGRKEVGEVLTSFTKEIKGKLSDVIIGHFPNKEAVSSMDVCSMEAEINVDERNIVNDVDGITGIALGSSEQDSPAFPGALRLASVQCFDEDENKKLLEKEKVMEITFRDVVDFIKERNVFPHQLYTAENIKQDKEFGSLYDEISTGKAEVERLEKELEESKKVNTELEGKAKLIIAQEKFDELLPKDLTEKQKAFIVARFTPEQLKDTEEGTIKDYIEGEKKQFAETAKLFGVTDGSQSGNSSGGNGESDETGNDEGDSTPEEEALKLFGVGA